MAGQLMSLAVIMLVAFLAPLLASLVPGRSIPEVVFLVFAGAILGPNLLGVFQTDGEAIGMLRELGLAFLFLMAGYEIDPRDIVSRTGAFATGSWAVSFGVALAVVALMAHQGQFVGGIAFAITLTTTAYGTLAPIMRERGLNDTPVGRAVTIYGSLGEILPVLAMAFLLSSRLPVATALILLVFVALCVVVAVVPQVARRAGFWVWRFLEHNAGGGPRPLVRMTVLILVFLVAVTAMFGLDVVLGAFAAGFIMRAIFPEGNEALSESIEGIGNGFLIPVFFVVSGAGIDLGAALSKPGELLGYIGLLVLVRGVMVGISLRADPTTRSMTWRERFSTSAYCTMALPLIVAVTAVAVGSGAMTQELASTLVTAGAITVLVIPVVTSLVRVTSAAHPVEGLQDLMRHVPASQINRERMAQFSQAMRDFSALNARVRAGGAPRLSSMDYLASVDARSGASRKAAAHDEEGASDAASDGGRGE